MNERIRELLAHAGFNTNRNSDVITNNHFGGYMDGRQFEKFTQLIVQECIGLLPEDCQSDNGCHAAWTIKEHFGVEE